MLLGRKRAFFPFPCSLDVCLLPLISVLPPSGDTKTSFKRKAFLALMGNFWRNLCKGLTYSETWPRLEAFINLTRFYQIIGVLETKFSFSITLQVGHQWGIQSHLWAHQEQKSLPVEQSPIVLTSVKIIKLPYSALVPLLQGCQSNHFTNSTASSALSVVTELYHFGEKAGWVDV